MNNKETLLYMELMHIFPFLRDQTVETRSFPIEVSDAMLIGKINAVMNKSDVEMLSCMQREFPGSSIADVLKCRKLLDAYLKTDRLSNDAELQAVIDFLNELRNRKIKESAR